jgi:hypothetical protein
MRRTARRKAEDLFRPFEQLNAERTGLGLGLAISRRGVEANGGRLTVRNIPDKGCVFTVDIPTAAPPALRPGPEAGVRLPASSEVTGTVSTVRSRIRTRMRVRVPQSSPLLSTVMPYWTKVQ